MPRSSLVFLLLPACNLFNVVFGNGETVEETREVDAFTALDIAASFEVEVTLGDAPSVTVTCDDNLLSLIVTTVKDGTLVIDQRNAVGAWAAIHPKAECHADIVTTSLIAVNASGAGDVHLVEADWIDLAQVGLTGAGQIVVDGVITAPDLSLSSHGAGELFVNGITGDSLTIEITGSGIAGITDIDTLALTASVRGSGSLVGTGSADTSDISCTGSGDVRTRELVTTDVHAMLTGSGSVQVNAVASITATVSGSGTLAVWGGPDLRDVNRTGSGSVVFRD
jgi:hypothetical protein